MSVSPGLGAFNKDKVASKFGIQLKTKEVSERSSPLLIPKKSTATTTETETESKTPNATKTKTISDFRKDNNANGFLSNASSTAASNTLKLTKTNSEKSITSKSSSELVITSTRIEESHSLTKNNNHSTKKSSESLLAKSAEIPNKSNVKATEQVASTKSNAKSPNVSTTNSKTEAQIEHQKDQPLYKRQLSKPLDNIISTNNTSTSSLKR